MLSHAKLKWIHSLEQKKFRQQYGLFTAEGNKLTSDLLDLLPCRLLVATEEWLKANPEAKAEEILSVEKEDIHKASMQKNPQEVLGIFEIPHGELNPDLLKGKISLVLDNIQDPGNLGTILRIADWFGIEHVICSIGTVDAYNPKTVQATMGAIGRVKIHYTELLPLLEKTSLPVFGTFLEGDVIYSCPLPEEGLIIMGNEGNGIGESAARFVTQKLYIPDFPLGKTGSESLNVSVATAIVCSEFRRRLYGKTE
ncbi:MAG: RNA methyltransferase [Bacteroidales bacterium]|nr:RNA methyltransferase [Bacteroidales bacterium]